MPKIDPSIAVVISLYNGRSYIRDAVESVFAQSLVPAEVFVVDDASTDDGPSVVERLSEQVNLTLLRNNVRAGQSFSRNLGAKKSRSDLIAFLDQDDVWLPSHLARLRQPFIEPRATPLGWVYSDIDLMDSNGNLQQMSYLTRTNKGGEHPKSTLAACLSQNMMIWPSTALVSRCAFERVGGFDEELRGYEDDDLWLRIFCAGFGNEYISEPLTRIRQHGGQSHRNDSMSRSRMLYARKLLARFRDDPAAGIQHTKHIIARFLNDEISAVRIAAAKREKSQMVEHLNNLQVFEPYCNRTQRRSIGELASIMADPWFSTDDLLTAEANVVNSHEPAEELGSEVLKRQVKSLQAELDAVYSSLSWRITAPIRAARRMFKH